MSDVKIPFISELLVETLKRAGLYEGLFDSEFEWLGRMDIAHGDVGSVTFKFVPGRHTEKLTELKAVAEAVGIKTETVDNKFTFSAEGGIDALQNKLMMLSLIVDKEGINPKQAAATALQIAAAGVPKGKDGEPLSEAAGYFAGLNDGLLELKKREGISGGMLDAVMDRRSAFSSAGVPPRG